MSNFSGPHDVLIEHVVAIADALDGSTETASTATGDRLRDALARIADAIESGSFGGGSLPDVTAADNGRVLMVVDGEWAVGNASAKAG